MSDAVFNLKKRMHDVHDQLFAASVSALECAS
jgi:hypothetical protein